MIFVFFNTAFLLFYWSLCSLVFLKCIETSMLLLVVQSGSKSSLFSCLIRTIALIWIGWTELFYIPMALTLIVIVYCIVDFLTTKGLVVSILVLLWGHIIIMLIEILPVTANFITNDIGSDRFYIRTLRWPTMRLVLANKIT